MAQNQAPTYEEALAELDKIVQTLQRPDCKIETLQSATARALELLRYCKKQLFETDGALKEMLAELESTGEA